MIWLLLVFIGLIIGAFGTLLGVAGGFLLVPILLFMYPGDTPSTITSITLTVAFFNALSGSFAYARLKRIDYRSGLMFSIMAVPGAILGAYVLRFLDRQVFEYVFSSVLVLVAIYLLFRPRRKAHPDSILKKQTVRKIIDSHGNVHEYSFSMPLSMIIAFFVGVVAGLLGIGGGIIHVPAMTQIMAFPIYIATATSHFVVAISTLAAIFTHVADGTYSTDLGRVLALSVGAIVGAQIGARLSHRVGGVLIVRLLAIGLIIVAVRLLIKPV
jgi:uncharacterized protein